MIIGAYPRIFYNKQYHYSWVAIAGAAILLFSRTFEGAFLILTVALCAWLYILKKFNKEDVKDFFIKLILPIIIIGGGSLAFQLHYNKTITGDYLNMPYIEYSKQRDVARSFWFLENNEQVRSKHVAASSMQNWELESSGNRYKQTFTFAPISIANLVGLTKYHDISEPVLLFISLVTILITSYFLIKHYIKRKKIDVLLALFLSQTLAVSMITWLFVPHYFTVWFVTYLVLVVVVLHRGFFNSKQKRSCIVRLGILFSSIVILLIIIPNEKFANGNLSSSLFMDGIISRLEKTDGKYIVFVNQTDEAKKYALHFMFVRNEPDIENSKIIWAWDISPEQNKRLIDSYPNREVWYLTPPFNNFNNYSFKKFGNAN